MNRRDIVAIVALVLAVPLFAWPAASPPPDPPDTFRYNLAGSGEAFSGRQINHTVPYETLSTDGKRIVRKTIAAENDTYTVRGEKAAPQTFGQNSSLTFVGYRNTTYAIDSFRRPWAPPFLELAYRVISLSLGAILGVMGGYQLVVKN